MGEEKEDRHRVVSGFFLVVNVCVFWFWGYFVAASGFWFVILLSFAIHLWGLPFLFLLEERFVGEVMGSDSLADQQEISRKEKEKQAKASVG